MQEALVCFANGSEDIEVITPADFLNRGGIKVTRAAVCPEGREVTLAHGTRIVTDGNIAEFSSKTFDLIVIPGGLDGAAACRDSEILVAMLKAQKQAKRLIGAICAAPGFVLGTHGIIGDNDEATGYPGFTDPIKNPSAKGVVFDRKANIITAKGPAYAIEFSSVLLQALAGSEIASSVNQDTLYAEYKAFLKG